MDKRGSARVIVFTTAHITLHLLFETYRQSRKSHKAIVNQFGFEWVKKRDFPEMYGRFLNSLYDDRDQADYGEHVPTFHDAIEQIAKQVESFAMRARREIPPVSIAKILALIGGLSMLCKKTLLLFVLVILAGSAVGCGSTTPTSVVPTPSPVQVTVVVTPTPPPPTATSEAPSLTPLPTVGVTETVPVAVTPLKPTTAAGTPKPAATKKPAPPTATVTPSPLPLTLPAPVLVRPNFDPGTGQKDERHSPSDALVFEWQSISPLAQGVCYMIRVDLVPTNSQPGTGDAFLQCDPNETQKAQSVTVRFTLYQPGRTGVNYSGLLPNPPTDLWVKWYATVVADQGAGPGPFDPISGVRHKVVPLSPKSNTFQFLLKGGGQ